VTDTEGSCGDLLADDHPMRHIARPIPSPGRCRHLKGPPHVNKVQVGAAEAVADIPDGASLAVGGFGLSGVPEVLVRALYEQGAGGLKVVSNNCGVDGRGLGVLLAAGRIARVTGSYVGENKETARSRPSRPT